MADEEIRQEYYTIITLAGQRLLAESIHGGPPVDPMEIAVGDGGGAYYRPAEDMTALKHECWRGLITSKRADPDNPAIVEFETVIPAEHGGFFVREIALYDSSGAMLSVGNFPDAYKVKAGSGAINEFPVVMRCLFTNADRVDMTVRPTAVASRGWVQEQIDTFCPTEPLVRLSHSLDGYPSAMGALLKWGAGMGEAGKNPAGGTPMRGIPLQYEWISRSEIIIKAPKLIAALGGRPQARMIAENAFIVTFESNNEDSIYIELLPNRYGSLFPPETAVQIQNLVFGDTPPEDKRVLWGDTSK